MPARPPRVARARPVAGQKTFYRLGVIALVVLFLYHAQVVLVPLSLAILLAFALTPVSNWLEKRGVGRVPSSLLAAAAALAVVVGILVVVERQGERLTTDMRTNTVYQANVKTKLAPVLDLITRLEKLTDAAAPEPDPKPPGEPPKPSDPPVPVVAKSHESGVLAYLPGFIQPVAELLANLLLVTVLTIFLLAQRESARDRLLGLAGRRGLTTTTRAMEDAARRVSRFLLLQAGTNAAMGVLLTAALYFIGIPYAPLWGLLSAALRFLPFVGIWLSALFPFVLALAVFNDWGHALGVLAAYAVLDLIMTNAVEPLLFGHGTGVSSLALLLAAVFWAFLWGAVGLLLAVPLTVCLVVLGERVPSLGFLRTLLGDEPDVDPADLFYHRVLGRDFDAAASVVEAAAADDKPLVDVYDDVLLPAMAQAKREADREEIDRSDERTAYRAVRDVLSGPLALKRTPPERPAGSTPAVVVGCSTRGVADRVALELLRDIATPAGCDVVIVPAARLVAEVATRTGKGEKVSACVGAVSPGGLAQAAGLCRQVKAKSKGVTVVVGRWGVTEDKSGVEKYLKDAGADKVAWTLKSTLAEILPPGTAEHAAGRAAGAAERAAGAAEHAADAAALAAGAADRAADAATATGRR